MAIRGGQVAGRSGRRPPRGAALLLCALFLSGCGDGEREARRAKLGPDPTLEARMAIADPSAGASLFGPCAACHTIGRGGVDLAGPNLYAVMGAPIGRRHDRYGYTAALRAVGGVWSDEAMDAWLADPARFAPGTKMTFPGMPDALARADLIAYLHSQNR
ncbi:c-type cytochrome [Aureimonas sp. AU40]|uniref:c-type cytochrome n=1 Tax=Aureimonas sp. AU40 TaxID=1637747 RepID=UPI000781A727|nr:c-type cytochrome [Aureimonas sp. AU40]